MQNKTPTHTRKPNTLFYAILALLTLAGFLAIPLNTSGQSGNTMGTAPSPFFDHLVVVLMENHGLSQIYGSSSAPYMTGLANTYGLATHYSALSHPSEGNYISLIGGSNFGHTGDGYCCWGITAPNIIDRIESAGLTWQAFAEDATGSGTCNFTPPRNADHFPFKTFSDMNITTRCSHFLTTASSSDAEVIASLNSAAPPNYLWLTPNDCNNMHSCSVSTGDNYLKALVPKILASNLFKTQKAALFVTFDEGNNNYPSDYVYAVWAGPSVKKGHNSTVQYTHYSFLKTIETAWNLTSLQSNDNGATAMTEFLGTSSPQPFTAYFTWTPTSPSVAGSVTFTASISGGASPYKYSWKLGDGATDSANPANHSYSSANTYTVTLTVTDSSNSSATTSNQITLSSSPTPLTSLPIVGLGVVAALLVVGAPLLVRCLKRLRVSQEMEHE